MEGTWQSVVWYGVVWCVCVCVHACVRVLDRYSAPCDRYDVLCTHALTKRCLTVVSKSSPLTTQWRRTEAKSPEERVPQLCVA